jgi:hypothetical protein
LGEFGGGRRGFCLFEERYGRWGAEGDKGREAR